MPTTPRPAAERITIRALPPVRPVPSLAEEVAAGLLEPPRTLPPKFFYDAKGSTLFDQICETREYYPTRTEGALLATHAEDIVNLSQADSIVELGAGTCRKTRTLLDACARSQRPVRFLPQDVCGPILEEASAALADEFPWLEIEALVGDYHAGLGGLPEGGRRLFLFLGGTIGNFEAAEAREFLTELAEHMGPEDHFLVGADRVKDPDVLRAAYNDAAGLTAAFNLNVLDVLNRELGAGFDVANFRHQADFNAADSQIEMRLVARRDQNVPLGELRRDLTLTEGESIRTEISRKFTPERLEILLRDAGLTTVRHFEPANGYFSLALARRAA